MSPQTFIIFGMSGSGKGTQADLLIKYLAEHDPGRETLYIDNGQQFRDFADSHHSLTATMVKDIMQHGELLPEFLAVWMWSNTLINSLTTDKHLVMEGLSRRSHEAPVLDSAIQFYKREKPFVISIEVSKEWSTDRLLGRGRQDDTREDIINRLGWYEDSVRPSIDYFKQNPYYTFLSINGEQTIEGVHQEILSKAGLV